VSHKKQEKSDKDPFLLKVVVKRFTQLLADRGSVSCKRTNGKMKVGFLPHTRI
jgi:hypothetical protein